LPAGRSLGEGWKKSRRLAHSGREMVKLFTDGD